MPTTLPVPSRGALRTLRHLALGTSCTVAFSAGLLTEDRRRRIQGAREVHENACRIKNARGYHSSGLALADIVDDHDVGFGESIMFTADLTMRRLTKETNEAQKEASAGIIEGPGEYGRAKGATDSNNGVVTSKSQIPSQFSYPTRKNHRKNYRQRNPFLPFRSERQLHLSKDTPLNCGLDAKGQGTPQQLDRQTRLAFDVARILTAVHEPVDVDAAALRFLDAFEEGIDIPPTGIHPRLLNIAGQLSGACMKYGKPHFSEQILSVILRYPTPIEESLYLSFFPYTAIQRILNNVSKSRTGDAEIEKACSVYLKTFLLDSQIPGSLDRKLAISIGERLFRESHQRGLHKLTHDLYFRINRYRDEDPKSARDLGHLINATYEMGKFKKVDRYFRNFYMETKPNAIQLSDVVRCVVRANIKSGKLSSAEQSLAFSNKMAVAGQFSSPTTPVLELLGHQWRSTRDISRTVDLFERLKPCLKIINHPKAVYGAIIQFCVEANAEDTATLYYEQLRESHTLGPADLRIFGHFSLAKAMAHKWAEAEEDLKNMALLSSTEGGQKMKEEFTSSFVPVLKLFAKSHSVTATENFILGFMKHDYLALTAYISNIMISAYAESKEIDSLVRWVETACASGCPIDSVSINIVLKYCHTSWKFSFEQTFQMYKWVCELGGGHRNFTDRDTLEILRQIAQKDAPNTQCVSKRLTMLNNLGTEDLDWDTKGALRAMSKSLAENDPAGVLKTYDRAVSSGVLMGPKHVAAAVTACLQSVGLEASSKIVKDARDRGVDVRYAVAHLIIHKITCVDVRSAANVRDLAAKAISSLEEASIPIDQSILTHTMSLLVNRGDAAQAIDFWAAMSSRHVIPISALELETISVLMKAYCSLENRAGIVWVTETLAKSRVVPDMKFKVDLANILKVVEKRLNINKANPNQHLSDFANALRSLSILVRNCRQHATLEKRRVREMAVNILNTAIKTRANSALDPESSTSVSEIVVQDSASASRPSAPRMKESPRLSTIGDEEPVVDTPSGYQYGSLIGAAAVA